MKLAFVVNDDFSAWHFRGGLIRELVSRGVEVSVVAPPGAYRGRLESLGARCIDVPMSRFVNPISDGLLAIRLFRLFRRERFDIVHNITVKPNIFGTFASRAAGIRRSVCLVSGLGFVFADRPSFRGRLIRGVLRVLYRRALALSHKTWFQNPDDLDQFVKERLIRPEKGVVIKSSGINLEEYSSDSVSDEEKAALRRELGIPADAKIVLMVTARLVWSKGVREFVESAARLHEKHPIWRFVMVAPCDPGSPDSVPDEYLETHRSSNLVVVDRFRDDIKLFTALSEIVVLPSYYREGVPRSLLEGLAMSKPVVTCDSVGCREVVEDGRNGYLVPIKDSSALAARLDDLMSDEEKRREFGRQSRDLAGDVFDEKLVVRRVFEELYELSAADPVSAS